jgi:hypothetical protein
MDFMVLFQLVCSVSIFPFYRLKIGTERVLAEKRRSIRENESPGWGMGLVILEKRVHHRKQVAPIPKAAINPNE